PRHGTTRLSLTVPCLGRKAGTACWPGTARGLAVPCLGTVEPCRAQACPCRAGTARPNGHVYVECRMVRNVRRGRAEGDARRKLARNYREKPKVVRPKDMQGSAQGRWP